MGCCSSREQKVDKHPLIIDVEQTIADEAWRMFYFSKGRFRRMFLKREDYTIEVPMNYYHFQEIRHKFDDLDIPVKADTADDASGTTSKAGNNKGKHHHPHREKLADPEHIGLETDFKNSTGEKQTYNFKFEKTRKATMSVTYQKGYSIGGKANFSLGLPKVLASGKIGTEVDMHVTVTKTTGETFEKTLTTSATSDITVAPRSHYTATVVMEERALCASFKVWVMMSMPAKEARAFIKNKRGQAIFFYKLRNLSELFPKETHMDETEKNSKQKDKEESKDPQLKDKEESKIKDTGAKDTHTKDSSPKDTHGNDKDEIKDEHLKAKEDKEIGLGESKDAQAKEKKKKKARKDAVMFVVEGMVDGVQMASHRIQLTDHESVDKEVQTTGK